MAIRNFGSWAVTKSGVESLTHSYLIEKVRIINEEAGYTWEEHMSQKNWVNMQDFRAAIEFAREYFKTVK